MEPADSLDLVDVPTVAEYKKAFEASKPALKSAGGRSLILDMLRANYQAPNHTLTPGDLAAQVSLATFKQANLRYTNFAKELCKHLGRDPKVKLAVLVKFSGGKPGGKPNDDDSMSWTLLPEVVQALEETWFSHLKEQQEQEQQE